MTDLLSVEASECTHCGDCAAACPMALITVDGDLPQTAPEAPSRCILCGHCVAACPTEGLQHSKMPMEQCQALTSAWRSTPAAVGQLIKGRRSIRHYESRPVDKSVLLSILDIARYAPTGMNTQSVKWLLVYDSAQVKRLAAGVIDWMREMAKQCTDIAGRYNAAPLVAAWEAGRDPILRGCPHLLIAYGLEADPVAPGSCMIALTTAEIAALPFGLGTCWAGFLHWAVRSSPQMKQLLNLPANCVMHGGLMIGYPAETYTRIPPRKNADVIIR